MKILRFLGILILLLVAILLIVGLFAPKDITIERSVVVNAPQNAASDYMFRFSNFKSWSPWQDLDSNMTSSIEGNDGQVGCKYSWSGKEVGVGNMVVTNRTAEEMDVDLNFVKPFEKHSKSLWKVVDAGNHQSKISWSFSSHYGFPWNGLMMIMGMKKMMGKDFDKGLNKLKTVIENQSATPNFSIQEVQFPGGHYVGIRQTVGYADMEKFFSNSYEQLGKAAGEKISGKPVGIFFTADDKAQSFDVMAAFPTKDTQPIANTTSQDIPASSAYTIAYKGGYSGSYAAHEALKKQVETNHKKINFVIEEYVVNPGDTKDSNAYETNIYYLYQ